ncbi:hypothetical protein B0H34DRAFT_215988 [Crassisporium funariophilum]|nr:hypothetical protein B0H34DRAFT_215988 [Crassisporium funariophilum]
MIEKIRLNASKHGGFCPVPPPTRTPHRSDAGASGRRSGRYRAMKAIEVIVTLILFSFPCFLSVVPFWRGLGLLMMKLMSFWLCRSFFVDPWLTPCVLDTFCLRSATATSLTSDVNKTSVSRSIGDEPVEDLHVHASVGALPMWYICSSLSRIIRLGYLDICHRPSNGNERGI